MHVTNTESPHRDQVKTKKIQPDLFPENEEPVVEPSSGHANDEMGSKSQTCPKSDLAHSSQSEHYSVNNADSTYTSTSNIDKISDSNAVPDSICGKSDRLSEIDSAHDEPLPSRDDGEVQHILFVRRMQKAFHRTGIERLRLAWKMGKVLTWQKEKRPHGNSKDQDETWEQYCWDKFGFCSRTADRYIEVAEDVLENELDSLTLAEARRRIEEKKHKSTTVDGELEPEEYGSGDGGEPNVDGTGGEPDVDGTGGGEDEKDRIEKDADRLKDKGDAFYKVPRQMQAQFQKLVQLVVDNPKRRDQDNPVGIDLATFLDDISTKMKSTTEQITAAVAEMRAHLDKTYPSAWSQYQEHKASEQEKERAKAQAFCDEMNKSKDEYGEEWYVDEDGKPSRRKLNAEDEPK